MKPDLLPAFDIPDALWREMQEIARRVAVAGSVRHPRTDLLAMVYVAGVYHGMKLQEDRVRSGSTSSTPNDEAVPNGSKTGD